MDSRESQQHHHHHQQWPPGMMMAPPPNSYNQNMLNNGNTNPMITPNSAENQLVAYNQVPMNSQYSDGSSAGGGPAGGAAFSVEPTRKKRGRPRKYSPDGNIAAGAPTPVPAAPISTSTGQGDSAGAAGSEPSAKRSRGRPPGSGKKQLDALAGAPGVGFTPHVITVKSGEDVSARIMAFSHQGPRTVCILSANGSISNVTLRQPAMSGGTVTVEGRFEIISLSGSYSPAESNGGGNRSRPGGLSVSLAGSDGRVLGGGVAGMLIAATPVQVVVGSFIADGKKPKSGGPTTSSTPPPVSASAAPPPPPNMLNFGGGPPTQGISPPSEGASSESSDDSDSSPFNQGPEPFDDPNPPIHNNYPPIYGSDWQSNNMNMYRN
jgi:predicted DNA-binding protein with PD1-like motif